MTNINIEIPEELHKKIKIESVRQSTTIKDLIINALKEEADK